MTGSPMELGGFDYLKHSDFTGSLICSFPLSPTSHSNLLSSFLQNSASHKPFRVVFFMSADTPIPTTIRPYHIQGDLTPYNIFVIQNRPARRYFHVNLKSFFNRFHKHYSISQSILPPLRSPTKYIQSLDHLSHLYWAPEIGLRMIAPPTLDMTEHDPALYIQYPLEMRLLGLKPPSSPLTFMHNSFFTQIQPKLYKHYVSIYHRRTQLWQKFCSLLKSTRESDH